MIVNYQGIDRDCQFSIENLTGGVTLSDDGGYVHNKTGLISDQASLKGGDQRLNREDMGHDEKRNPVFLLFTDGIANLIEFTNGRHYCIRQVLNAWGYADETRYYIASS
ncbi:hypothetical protein [Streptococcus ovuberis]|uniref:Uncharacterized protein n=1 Tax=Streptococcus ovuberis TaxID=1936207 RepID=A0A7X6MYS9_9STRE|nr:hypothetical protein [Streptococcus ovuberis]NKZ20880.1 hypothetical protein [Streptococcus ovuberis]